MIDTKSKCNENSEKRMIHLERKTKDTGAWATSQPTEGQFQPDRDERQSEKRHWGPGGGNVHPDPTAEVRLYVAPRFPLGLKRAPLRTKGREMLWQTAVLKRCRGSVERPGPPPGSQYLAPRLLSSLHVKSLWKSAWKGDLCFSEFICSSSHLLLTSLSLIFPAKRGWQLKAEKRDRCTPENRALVM